VEPPLVEDGLCELHMKKAYFSGAQITCWGGSKYPWLKVYVARTEKSGFELFLRQMTKNFMLWNSLRLKWQSGPESMSNDGVGPKDQSKQN